MRNGLIISGLALLLLAAASFAQDKDAPKGDIAKGQDVFEGQCYDCHNADSDVVKMGPGFKGVKNGKLPSGKPATRENVLAIVNQGQGEMPPFADMLSDQEKEDVIAYVLSR
jgi:mono/diheme cytochrome c family protein